MHLTFSGRMILYNVIFFIVTFCLVIFFVIQGITLRYVNDAGDQLTAMAQDANLYIKQELHKNAGATDDKTRFLQNANRIGSGLATLENTRVRLYDLDGQLIADSSSTTGEVDLNEEVKMSMTNDTAVMTLTKVNSISTLYYVAPITVNNSPLGYVGYIHYLEEMDNFFSITIVLFVFGGVIGLIVLFIVVLNYSSHFVQPIRDLTKISKEITDGNYNVNIHYSKDDEIGDLTKVYNQMSSNIDNVVLQLQSEQERLGGVLASIDDGLLAIDTEGNIITFNSYIKTYFGVINPKTIYDFKYQSFLRDIYDSLKTGKKRISEEIDCDGRNLLLIGSRIQKTGLEENYMIVIKNITPTKQLQNEQRKFISSVSHELRTPLTTIIGYTDMLQRRHVDQKILDNSLSTINREGHRLLRLVDDLLNVNQFDKLEFDFKKQILNIYDLLVDVVAQMQIKAFPREIDISYKSDNNLPNIYGDYDRLSQLFINILHNAIKYSDSGGIIDVISTYEDQRVVVSIRDYGVGISEAEKNNIFNAFYRVEEDRARSEGEGGAGLGLYIVKEIVDKHDGEISIESQIGEGTNITVLFPAVEELPAGGDDYE